MPRPARPSSDARPIPTQKHVTQQSVDAAVWSICDVMRRGNVASSLQYVPELTWILFLRILDEQEGREAGEAEALGHGYEGSLAAPYRWADWARPIAAKAARGETNTRRELTEAGAGKFLEFVNARLIPHLKGLRDLPDAPQAGSEAPLTRSSHSPPPIRTAPEPRAIGAPRPEGADRDPAGPETCYHRARSRTGPPPRTRRARPMIARTSPNRITFAVAPVARTTKRRITIGPLGALGSLCGPRFIACSGEATEFIGNVDVHPLIAAASIAFMQRRPLALAPDMIWAAIVQGAARHVINHTGYLRPLLGPPAWEPKNKKLRAQAVAQGGRRVISVEGPVLAPNSPRRDWAEVVAALWAAVHEPRGATADPLAPAFSTTGPAERLACQVAPIDPAGAFCRSSSYRERQCGIPKITLEGTPADWHRLRAQVEHLAPYSLDWWLPSVRAICDQFARAADGDIDLDHWRGIQGEENIYRDHHRSGWLIKLIPYLREERGGHLTTRNPLLADPDATPPASQFPGGLGLIPFRCRWRGRAEPVALEWLGGFIGVTQDPATLALRPHLGWAVRPGAAFDPRLARLEAHAPRPPLDPVRYAQISNNLWMQGLLDADLSSFYQVCNGVRLLNCSGTVAYRFLGLDAVEIIDDPAGPPELPGGGRVFNAEFMKHHHMLRFCDLSDGSFFALGPRFAADEGAVTTPGPPLDETGEGWKVVLVTPTGAGNLAACPVVAWSFDEFLRRVLDGELLTDVD